MTNPFDAISLNGGGQKNEKSNPFDQIGGVAPSSPTPNPIVAEGTNKSSPVSKASNEVDYDNLPDAIAKSVMGGIWDTFVQGPTNVLRNIRSKRVGGDNSDVILQGLNKAADFTNQVSENLTPNINPNSAGGTAENALGSGIYAVSSLGAGNKLFGGSAALVDRAAAAMPSSVSGRATQAIAKIAANISGKASQLGLSDANSAMLGVAAKAAPKMVTAGALLDVITNPDNSLSSHVKNIGLGALGALGEGAEMKGKIESLERLANGTNVSRAIRDMARDQLAEMTGKQGMEPVAPSTENVASDAKPEEDIGNPLNPDFILEMNDHIKAPPKEQSSIPDLSTIYQRTVHYTKALEDLGKSANVDNINNPGAQAQMMTQGSPGLISSFIEKPYILGELTQMDDPNNPSESPTPTDISITPQGVKGLPEILDPIIKNGKKNIYNAYVMAKHMFDEGMLETKRGTFADEEGNKAQVIKTYKGYQIHYPDRVERINGDNTADLMANLVQNGYLNSDQDINILKQLKKNKAIETPFDMPNAVRTLAWVEKNHPDVVQAHLDSRAFDNAVLAQAKASGLISDRNIRLWNGLFENYVPLRRAFEENDSGASLTPTGKLVGLNKQFKKLMGSSRDILDPTFTRFDNAQRILRASFRNMALKKLAYIADNHPDVASGIVEPMTISDSDMQELRKEAGDYQEWSEKQGNPVSHSDAMDIVTKLGNQNILDPRSNIMQLYDNGVVKRYRVNKDIADALQGMSPAHIDGFFRFLGLPAQTLRAGIVDNPAFGTAHAIRDSFDATLQSNYGFKLGIDTWRGFLDDIGRGQYKGKIRDLMKMTGAYNSSIMNPIEVTERMLPQTATDRAITTFKHPIEALKKVTEPFLMASRVGEMMRAVEQDPEALDRYIKTGAYMPTPALNLFDAAYNTRNFLGDYAMHGSSGVIQGIAHTVAFGNPGLQSLDGTRLAIKRNPMGVLTKGIAGITFPTLLLYAMNHGDQQINDLRKSNPTFWYFRLPGGEIGRLPKPFILGQVFGTTMEQALDAMLDKDPNSLSEWAKNTAEQAKVAYMPTALQIASDLRSNKDNFTNAPIIPSLQEGIDPQYQHTSATSNLSKMVSSTLHAVSGGAINISPIQMDYVIKSAGGDLGKAGLALSGNKGPAKELGDYPFLSRFVAKYPTSNVAPLRHFYDNAANADQVLKTLSYLENRSPQELQQYITDHKNEIALAPVYTETKAQLSQLRKSVELLDNLDITPEKKKEMGDYLQKQIIEIARAVNLGIRSSQQPSGVGQINPQQQP